MSNRERETKHQTQVEQLSFNTVLVLHQLLVSLDERSVLWTQKVRLLFASVGGEVSLDTVFRLLVDFGALGF